MRISNQFLLLLPVMSGLALVCACEEEETVVIYTLCSPQIVTAAPASSDEGEPAPVSSAGGTLALTGKSFWVYFSSASDDSPVPFSAPYDIRVIVGSQSAIVTAAYERTIPGVTQLDLSSSDSTPVVSEVASTCATCSVCVQSNASGCGGCTNECAGCEQVLEIEVPQLMPAPSLISGDGEVLRAPIVVISGVNQSNAYYYDFIPACEDGVDNDGDNLEDAEDPSCVFGKWSEMFACEDGLDNDGDGWVDLEDAGCVEQGEHASELDACADGMDNDGDGQIDLEDEACAGDSRGQSEEVSTAPSACSNGRDDDGDGLVDHEDTRCTSGPDDDESRL